MLTNEQAQLIMEAHDISVTLNDEEELECLQNNNPSLLEAYFALHEYAYRTVHRFKNAYVGDK